ncbi:MAG: glycosyltransferase family 2 protein [Planctomycetota bacterium]
MQDPRPYELTVVMPCLNEADTLATCIRKAWRGMKAADVHGEIVVADNGSVDGSIEIAQTEGARVVHVPSKGYGFALQAGIDAAQGQYVIMGDADDSYDFLEIPKFIEKLRQGHQLVQGCRLPSGGGTVAKGAMPFSHRWLGNPMFSFMVRKMYWSPIHDVYCGMRGFTREFYARNTPIAGGMEFATEMIIRASLNGEDTAEVPITLHPDGRKAHAPHLRTMRDGWRTLRFFMLRSPRYLFFHPGVVISIVGLALMLAGAFNLTIGPMRLDLHTMLVGALTFLLGVQAMQFGVFAKLLAIAEGFSPVDRRLSKCLSIISLERGLLLGSGAALIGTACIAVPTYQWAAGGFSSLEYGVAMRWVIPGVVLVAAGVQAVLGRCFAGALELLAERSLNSVTPSTEPVSALKATQKDQATPPLRKAA